MVYNKKFEFNGCSLSGKSVKVSLFKNEIGYIPDPFKAIGISGFKIKYKQTDKPTDPINGSELALILIADTDLTADELYTEDERTWLVKIEINNTLYWSGFLLPEGFSRPYDNGRYAISLRCTDVLGTLTNKPYQGLTLYKGFDTDKNVIFKCLALTDLKLPVVIAVNIFEAQMNLSICPLEQSTINQNRFIDANSKAFSAFEVLRSVLERYGCTIRQSEGKWVIINTLEQTKGNIPAYSYDENGNYLGQITVGTIITAGGTSEQAAILGTSHNISKDKAHKSAMSYYQYGYVTNAAINGDFSVLANGFFANWNKLNGVNAGVVDTITQDAAGNNVVTGHRLAVYAADTSIGQMVRAATPASIKKNEKVVVSFDTSTYGYDVLFQNLFLQLIITDNAGNYFTTGGWQQQGAPFGIEVKTHEVFDGIIKNISFEIPARAADYQLTISFAQFYTGQDNPVQTHFDNLNLSVSVGDQALTPSIGSYNRLTQIKNLTFVDDAILLLHGDEPNNLRTSQILVNGQPTVTWNRVGFGSSDNTSLLFITADSFLRLNSRPKKIFDGLISSTLLLSPTSLFSITQEDGLFLFLSGDFDLINEEYQLRLFEGLNEAVNILTPYEAGVDTGNLKDKTGVSVGQPSGIGSPQPPSTGNGGGLPGLTRDGSYLYLDGQKASVGYADYALNSNHANVADYATNANHANVSDYATEAGHALTADYALDSGKWSGALFADYLNQPVKTTSDVKFKSVGSPAFVSGFTGYGYLIDQNGNATFDNLTVRKQMNVYELTVNKINATNGALAVTDTIKILSVGNGGVGIYDCFIDTANGTILVPFQVNDLIRCQVWNGTGIKYYFAKVIYVAPDGSAFSITVIDGAGVPATGDVVVRFGNTSNTNRQGLLYLTASDTNAPYLDVLDGINSANLSGKTKVRLGRLDGIVDPDFGTLTGYGLYGGNVYLNNGVFRGSVTVTGGNAATQSYAQTVANTAQSNAQTFATTAANNAGATALSNATALVNNAATVSNNYAFAASYAAGKMLNRDPEFVQGFNSIVVYNNNQNNTVLHGRGTNGLNDFGNGIPNSSNCYLAIHYAGGGAIPGLGGFTFNTQSRANAVFVVRIVALIPVGYTINFASNQIGDGGRGLIYNSDLSGAGNWKEYLFTIECGKTGTFSTTNFFYLNGADQDVYWYLASATVYDMTAVEADPIVLAQNAQTAAVNYATAQSALEREVAKTYADGKVSAEEAARISQAVANLAEAKADSQAKFLTAVTNANGYTDTKTVAAITAAQMYADSVSTSKANAAQTAAIAAASTTAQNYATTAQNNAVTASQALINSLSIGGVNILNNSDFSKGLSTWSLNGGSATAVTINGKPAAQIVSSAYGNGIYTGIGNFIPYTDYTISFDIQGVYYDNLTLLLGISSFGTTTVNVPNTNVWTRVSYVVNTNALNGSDAFVIYGTGLRQVFNITNIKVEKGNKATDWSPSIADTNALIQAAQAAATAAQTAYNNLTANLKVTAFQDIQQWAIGGQTLVNGGLINTNLLDAAAIRANIITAGYIESLEVVSKNIRTSNNDKRVEILASENNIRIIKAGEDLITLDDDSALEGLSLQPNDYPYPPTVTKRYGPGIRVGSTTSLSASLSRKSLTLTDANGDVQHFIGQNLTGTPQVILDATGGFYINNMQYSGGQPPVLNGRVIVQEINVEGFNGTVLGFISN